MNTYPERFFAVIEIEAPNREDAETVLAERIDHDEDYGFAYTIDSEDLPLIAANTLPHGRFPEWDSIAP